MEKKTAENNVFFVYDSIVNEDAYCPEVIWATKAAWFIPPIVLIAIKGLDETSSPGSAATAPITAPAAQASSLFVIRFKPNISVTEWTWDEWRFEIRIWKLPVFREAVKPPLQEGIGLTGQLSLVR